VPARIGSAQEDSRVAELDESTCEFVWPSAAPSGCAEHEWCMPIIETTACVAKGTGTEGTPCTAYSDCAEGYTCLERVCTPLCIEQNHCAEGTACVLFFANGSTSLGYGRCRPTTPEPCCLTANDSCSCYEPCPYQGLSPSCGFDESAACCYSGLEPDGLPTCVCVEEVHEAYSTCADLVAGQARAYDTSLAVVETCSGG
jgi:hypothetical protein